MNQLNNQIPEVKNNPTFRDIMFVWVTVIFTMIIMVYGFIGHLNYIPESGNDLPDFLLQIFLGIILITSLLSILFFIFFQKKKKIARQLFILLTIIIWGSVFYIPVLFAIFAPKELHKLQFFFLYDSLLILICLVLWISTWGTLKQLSNRGYFKP